MIIVVADWFTNQFIGGAELTSDALLELGFSNYKKINSRNLDEETIERYQDKKWIFFNFEYVNKKCLLKVAKEIGDYSVVEYDYKYCKYRLKSKHESTGEKCDCENSTKGKLAAAFLYKSKNLFFMSSGQKKEYERVFPILKNHTSACVLGSVFSTKNLDYMLSLDLDKDDKYIILNSEWWVKGTQNCIKYAENNNLRYELVANISHKELLKKLASSKGLIFLPNGFDTCPRITIEAKILGCELILNDNVQHKDEEWFKDRESIIAHVHRQKEMFYERCLKQNIEHEKLGKQLKFHFIIPGYNASEWLERCVISIQRQEYENYSVTYIDDMSTDNSIDVYKKITKGYNNYNIVVNTNKDYALKNIAKTISAMEPRKEDIIIVLDADDWLSSPDVLSYLNTVYQKQGCWLTYGSYMYYPFGDVGVEPSDYPQDVVENNLYREDNWRASHLRTFKKKLWDKINQQDLVDDDGEYYKMAYDQAMMLPMLEMAREKAKYIPEVLHVYNRANSINVDKQKRKQQYETMLRIRKRKKYERVNFED